MWYCDILPKSHSFLGNSRPTTLPRRSPDFPVFNIFICIYGNDKNMAEKLN